MCDVDCSLMLESFSYLFARLVLRALELYQGRETARVPVGLRILHLELWNMLRHQQRLCWTPVQLISLHKEEPAPRRGVWK